MTMKEDSKQFLSSYITYLKVAVAKLLIDNTPEHLSPKKYSRHIQMVLHNKRMSFSKRKDGPLNEDQESASTDKQIDEIIENYEIKAIKGSKNKKIKKGSDNDPSIHKKTNPNTSKLTSATSEGNRKKVNKSTKNKKITKGPENCSVLCGLPDFSTSKKKKDKENKIIGVIEPILNNLIFEKPSKEEKLLSQDYLDSCNPSSYHLENKVATNNIDSVSFVNKTIKPEDTNSITYWPNDNGASAFKSNARCIVINDSFQSKESIPNVNNGLNFSKEIWQNIDEANIIRNMSSELVEDLSWDNCNTGDYYGQNKGIVKYNNMFGDYFPKDILNKRTSVKQLNNFTDFDNYNKNIYQNPNPSIKSIFLPDFRKDELDLNQMPYFNVSDGIVNIPSNNLLNFNKSFDENNLLITDQANTSSSKGQESQDFSCQNTSEEWAFWCYVDQVERALFKCTMENWNQCQKASQVLVDELGETNSSLYLRKPLMVFFEKVMSILTGAEVDSNNSLVEADIGWSILSDVMSVLKAVYSSEVLAVDSTWICIGAFVKFSSMLTRNSTSQSKGGYSVLPEVGSHLVTMITSLIKSILHWLKEGITLSRIYQWTSSESSINSSTVNLSFNQSFTLLQTCSSDVTVSSLTNWEIEFYIAEWKIMLEKDCLVNMEKTFPFLAIQISDLLYYLEQIAPTMLSY